MVHDTNLECEVNWLQNTSCLKVRLILPAFTLGSLEEEKGSELALSYTKECKQLTLGSRASTSAASHPASLRATRSPAPTSSYTAAPAATKMEILKVRRVS
mgnify:CR=1 FL=1